MAQDSQLKTLSSARRHFLLSRTAHTQTREHTLSLKGTAYPERTSKRLRTQSKRRTCDSWCRIGEAYSAFRGWRPIPAALPSHSIDLCSGTEEFPSNQPSPTKRKAVLRG